MDNTFIQPEASFIPEANTSELITWAFSNPITDKMTKGLKYTGKEGKNIKRFPVDEEGKSIYKKSLSRKDTLDLETTTTEYNTIKWCASEETLARLKYPSIWKTYDIFTRRIHPDGTSIITIEEYQKITKTKSYSQALQTIEQAGNLLVELRLTATKLYKDGEKEIEGFSPLNKYKRNPNGVIEVKFTSDFTEMLLENPPFPIPSALYSIDEKESPIAYYLGRKIWEHAHINRRGTFTLSIKTLLEACYSILPLEKEVKKTDRAYTRRIIRPLEKAFEVIDNKVKEFKWNYLGNIENGKREILSREEVSSLNFSLWKALYIGITIKDYEKLLTKVKLENGKKVNNILPPVKE